MKITTTFLIPNFDISTEDKQRIQRVLNEINEATENAVAEVMVTNGIRSDLLTTAKATADDARVVVADKDKIIGIRKHNKLPTGRQQETLNKFWATLLPSAELHHPDDPNYN